MIRRSSLGQLSQVQTLRKAERYYQTQFDRPHTNPCSRHSQATSAQSTLEHDRCVPSTELVSIVYRSTPHGSRVKRQGGAHSSNADNCTLQGAGQQYVRTQEQAMSGGCSAISGEAFFDSYKQQMNGLAGRAQQSLHKGSS